MTLSSNRTYLDWNATAPLRPEARQAMIATMDVVGNPSSVHAEGRAATAVIERARAQVAEAFGAQSADIVFTSGATEAAALALADRGLHCGGIEHDCVAAWCTADLPVDRNGAVTVSEPDKTALQMANSETGILQEIPQGLVLCDAVQAFGKIPTAFDWSGVTMSLLSAHKIGGPKGIGALVLKKGTDVVARIRGGGQEMGRRSGTENLLGIAGFGAAAQAAAQDLSEGVWDGVAKLRISLEERLANGAPDAILIGRDATRLPNTTCIAVPGWKGDTQVMQMDLAGFAISAGSACSSGKVKSSRVLKAIGYDDMTAASAIRVSIGPQTTASEVAAFADAWLRQYEKFRARAA